MYSVEFPVLRASFQVRSDDEIKSECNGFALTNTMLKLQDEKRNVPRHRAAATQASWSRLVDAWSNPATKPANLKLASRAYWKLEEIMSSCVLPYPKRSVHLCESPGGFVQATSQRAPPNWTWIALSLNDQGSPTPFLDALPMDRGRFVDGDVMDVALCERLFEKGTADLVTADGAHRVQHDSLEEDHFDLLLAQTRVALHALAPGGTFILKFFEGAQKNTLQLIAFLTHVFESLSVIKPVSSRVTNSERYVVGRNFTGGDEGVQIAHVTDLMVSPDWTRDIQATLDVIADQQICKLREVFARIQAMTPRGVS